MTDRSQNKQENPYLWPMLRSLPYFRAILRAVEAVYYTEFALPSPVLDVGCGDGHFASVVFSNKLDVGLDPSRPSLREARRWDAYRQLVQAEGARAPFANGYFASAVSNSVLEHIADVEAVLKETARLLKPGALFIFCVPNPNYFKELGVPRVLPFLGNAYKAWFRRISRVHHADTVETWGVRLSRSGFSMERHWSYFSPAAMRALDWGHYFSAPALLPRMLTGRWLFTSAQWNLALTAKLVSRYAEIKPDEAGAFTFFVCRKV